MDFIEEIRNLSARIIKQKDVIQTEEATKTAFVMPFINLLGYDVFNPTEVVPEFTADVGTQQGEKVDYAIFKDDEVIMLIECKKFGEDLSDVHTSQLYRYFSVAHARIAVLTDGVLYRFYTDLEESNIMDTKPFLEFDMLDIQPPLVNELKQFTKPVFDLDKTLTAASDLKYTKEIKQTMMEQLETPSGEVNMKRKRKRRKRIEYRSGICFDVFPGMQHSIEVLHAQLKSPDTDSRYKKGLMMNMAYLSFHAIELFLKYKLQTEGITPNADHYIDDHFNSLNDTTQDRIESVFLQLRREWNVNPVKVLPENPHYDKANKLYDPKKWEHIGSLLTQIRSYNESARYVVEKGQSFVGDPNMLLVAVTSIYRTLDDRHIET